MFNLRLTLSLMKGFAITQTIVVHFAVQYGLGRQKTSLSDSTFDLYSKVRDLMILAKALLHGFPLVRLVQLYQSDSACNCSNLREGLSNDAHNRDIPVSKSLERLPYPKCHHRCLGAGFDRCSRGTV